MSVIKFAQRLFVEQPSRFLLVIGTTTAAGLLEGLAVALLVPLLTFAGGAATAETGSSRIVVLTKQAFSMIHQPLTIGNLLIFIFMVAVGQQALVMVQQKIFFGSLYSFEARLREKLYRTFFAAGWPFFLKQKVGNLTNALTIEVTRAGMAFFFLSYLLTTIIVILVYLALAAALSWQMTTATVLIGLATALSMKRFMRKATSYGNSISQINSDLQSEATEQLSGAKLIKGCAVEEPTNRQFSHYLNLLARSYYKANLGQAVVKSLFELISVGTLCVGIYIAIVNFRMSITTLIVFLFVFYRLVPRLANTQSYVHNLLTNLPALALIDRLQAEAGEMRERTGGQRLADLKSGLTLRDLSFSYVPDKTVLEEINLDIPAGKTTALVGGSGAGKSTVIDLVTGLLTPITGRILIDDISLDEIDLGNWRRLIGYMAQDTILFHATVKTNISWGSDDITDEEIEAAAGFAFAHEFIDKLPQGYDTIVGDRGVRLSGGQRQRLALARALVRQPKLLILDEATSALDAESEHKIQAAISSLARKMTILIVTHRLATIKNADYIYVLEDGRIAESGTWAELSSRPGRFSHLKEMQDLTAGQG